MLEREEILDQIAAASFDDQIAFLRADSNIKIDAFERLSSATIQASEAGIPHKVVEEADLDYRARAALEEGNVELAEGFMKASIDTGVDNSW